MKEPQRKASWEGRQSNRRRAWRRSAAATRGEAGAARSEKAEMRRVKSERLAWRVPRRRRKAWILRSEEAAAEEVATG